MDTPHFENIHQTQHHEEEEETLSLSDLPLYGDDQSDEWEQDLSTQLGSTSVSSSENDYFEFSSQEYFSPSPTAVIPPENIIFCGKFIFQKQPYCDAKSSVESRKQEAHNEKNRNWGVSRREFGSSKSTSERCIDSENDKTSAIPFTLVPKPKKDKDRHISSPLRNSPKKVKGCDFPVQKFPVMASSSSGKAKWYLFLFGMSRFSSAMELKSINSRRSRRRQHPPPAFRFRSGDKNISDDHRDRGWRMEGLIGALSCGGHRQAETMVAASIDRAALKCPS